jgi:hypothetical protein
LLQLQAESGGAGFTATGLTLLVAHEVKPNKMDIKKTVVIFLINFYRFRNITPTEN